MTSWRAKFRGIFCVLVGLAILQPAKAAESEAVLVAGASGRSGIEIARALADAGYRVIGTTRDAARARDRFGSSIEWLEVDMLDPVAVSKAMDGIKLVVSALGHGDMVGPDSPQIVHNLALRNLIDAAAAHKARHMVIMSSSTAGHSRGIDHRQEARFGFVLHWMTKSEDHLIASGIPYTIVGPGGLVDGDTEKSGARILARKDYQRAMVSRKGVAQVVLLALRDPAARGKAVAVVIDPTKKPGEISGRFADVARE